MRISDWSSDVCSSDLFAAAATIGGEAVVAERADALAVGAAQQVDDMRRAEALAGGGDRVERVAGDLEAVLGHRRIEADVAVAAAFCFLAEVGEKNAAADQHGRASGRGRGWRWVEALVVAGALKKNKANYDMQY